MAYILIWYKGTESAVWRSSNSYCTVTMQFGSILLELLQKPQGNLVGDPLVDWFPRSSMCQSMDVIRVYNVSGLVTCFPGLYVRYHVIDPVIDHVVGHVTEGVKDHMWDHMIAWGLGGHVMHHMGEHMIVSQDHVLPFLPSQLDYS